MTSKRKQKTPKQNENVYYDTASGLYNEMLYYIMSYIKLYDEMLKFYETLSNCLFCNNALRDNHEKTHIYGTFRL